MKLFFLQSSTDNANSEKKMKKGSNKSTKKKKVPFISLLSYPSSSSSSASSSESTATTPTTTLPTSRRPSLIGRNASCLDAEYVVDYVSTSPSSLRPGKSTREELEIVLARLGGGREEAVAEILAEVDRDGQISVDEILTLRAAAAAAEEEEEEELRVAFAVYDADGDGKISAEELQEVFRMIGDDACTIADCRRMIRGVDSDGDGFVCFRDFVRMMSTGL